MLPSSNNKIQICPFSAEKIPGSGQPTNSSPSRRGCFACASRVSGSGLARHFSSRTLNKIKAYWSLEQSIGYWSESHNIFFHLNLADNAWHFCFSEIKDSFYGSYLQETIKQYTRWIFHRVFLEWWVIFAVFSNWYWYFQPSRLLVSYNVIFRVGSSCLSTWLTLLPLKILRTNNNHYPQLLDMLLSLQRCPEGILPFFLLLCPSESANDQRLGKFLLWISAAESPDDNNIPRRAVRRSSAPPASKWHWSVRAACFWVVCERSVWARSSPMKRCLLNIHNVLCVLLCGPKVCLQTGPRLRS